MIFGASGGIGHIAVQLAKRIGAEVLAVASEADGVALVRRLGADAAVDGRHDDVAKAVARFAPGGLDAALILVGGAVVDEALATMKKGGRVAHPNGVEPEPHAPKGVRVRGYDGKPSREAFERLNTSSAESHSTSSWDGSIASKRRRPRTGRSGSITSESSRSRSALS